MAKAYYSTVFEQPAPEIWKVIRDFNNYPVWVGGAGESRNGAKEGQPQGELIDSSSQGHRPLQRLTYRGRTALRRLAIGVAGYWCRRRRLGTRLIARASMGGQPSQFSCY